MNPKLLIDAIVRQTTVLIAQLSTAAGVRAPLAHLADQVFLELSRELESQGVSRKVAADMFGLALRSYQTKVQRLQASASDQRHTLWTAVLEYIEGEGTVARRDVLDRFPQDDPASLGAILNDLTENGIVYRTGTGLMARYRTTPDADRKAILAAADSESTAALVRIAIYRGISSRAALQGQLGLNEEAVAGALNRLLESGVIHEDDTGDLRTAGVTVPVGAAHGWEAAVFDHYQALVTAVGRKLTDGAARSSADDVIGGGTVSFELYDGHPLRDEVHGLLRRVRADVDALWRRVGDYNRSNRNQSSSHELSPPEEIVTFYFGQSLSRAEGDSRRDGTATRDASSPASSPARVEANHHEPPHDGERES